jgi:CPA2 family monovalent cation:H+ antiporter-2
VIVLLGVAGGLGVLLEKIRQNAIVGYLIAGTLLGPGALNLVRNQEVVQGMAEIGVALLLFSIGLEFSWARLRALGRVALLGGGVQVMATGAATYIVGRRFGLTPGEALAWGAILVPSSTACVMRLLQQRSELDGVHGRSSVGVLLSQDVAVIPLMLLISALGGAGSAGEVVVSAVSHVGIAAGFFVALFVVVNYVLPRVLDATVMSRNRELPILLAITGCLAAAWGGHSLGVSPALGAFAAGILLGDSPYATWIRADISALRTTFVTVFFTSVGMVDDLGWIADHWPLILGVVAAVIAAKVLIVWGSVWIAGLSSRHALMTGLCLAQIGEFSFVLAAAARGESLISEAGFRMAVAVTVASLMATPYLMAGAPWLARRLASSKKAVSPKDEDGGDPLHRVENHVVVVGCGPVGRGVIDALRGEAVVVVIDLNPKARLRSETQGIHVIVGDASTEEVLRHAHVADARAVVITLPDRRSVIEVAQAVRSTAPAIPILARARYHTHSSELSAYGIELADEELLTGTELGQIVRRRVAPPRPDAEP